MLPNDFLCPITLEIMNEPVICSDGYTYERQSILALHNNISPITRQLINRDFLIPNRALKNLIEEYKNKNVNTINVNTINVNEEIQELVNMFNEYDLPSFDFGKIIITNNKQYFIGYKIKFQFTLDMVIKIKNCNIELLLHIYKQLVENIKWIKKYVYNNDNKKGFVDYVYDFHYNIFNGINNYRNNEILKDIVNFINSHRSGSRYQERIRYNFNYDFLISHLNETYETLDSILKDLTEFNERQQYKRQPIIDTRQCLLYKDIIKNMINVKELDNKKTRDYYYINYDNFCGKNKLVEIYDNLILVNLDSEIDKTSTSTDSYSYKGNKAYNLLWHIYDREKKNRLNFLNILTEIIGKTKGTENELFLFDCHVNNILAKKNVNNILAKKNIYNNCRIKLINETDFNDLLKIAEIFVQIIECVKQF
jgi:hypothetical protein